MSRLIGMDQHFMLIDNFTIAQNILLGEVTNKNMEKGKKKYSKLSRNMVEVDPDV